MYHYRLGKLFTRERSSPLEKSEPFWESYLADIDPEAMDPSSSNTVREHRYRLRQTRIEGGKWAKYLLSFVLLAKEMTVAPIQRCPMGLRINQTCIRAVAATLVINFQPTARSAARTTPSWSTATSAYRFELAAGRDAMAICERTE